MAMKFSEYVDLVDEIIKNHGWNYLYENTEEKGNVVVKYVEFVTSFDTRHSTFHNSNGSGDPSEGGDVWVVIVKFHSIINGKREFPEIVEFKEDECTKDNILKWLEENKKPKT